MTASEDPLLINIEKRRHLFLSKGHDIEMCLDDCQYRAGYTGTHSRLHMARALAGYTWVTSTYM